MREHKVKVKIGGSVFGYNRPVIRVKPGDKIEWTLKNDYPWGIVIKAPVSPLEWTFKMTGKGRKITARVGRLAAPGHYPYAVGAFDGKRMLFDDPEIIVRRP